MTGNDLYAGFSVAYDSAAPQSFNSCRMFKNTESIFPNQHMLPIPINVKMNIMRIIGSEVFDFSWYSYHQVSKQHIIPMKLEVKFQEIAGMIHYNY